jgi:uncharacterized protein (DUF433 family)
MADVKSQRIEKTPGICGGRACIVGHRVRVMDIVVWSEKRGLSPEEIIEQFPGLILADVHAAMAYYDGHRDEITDEFRADEDAGRELLNRHPSKVQAKLGG